MAAKRSEHKRFPGKSAGSTSTDPRQAAAGSLILALAVAPWPAAAGTPPACSATLDVVGTNLGAIPDAINTGCGDNAAAGSRNVFFSVPSVPGFAVTDVDVSLALTHTWAGDLVARLVAPDARQHVLFGRIGATSATACGDSSDFGGNYVFSDFADPPGGGIWQAATGTSGPVPEGSYFTTDSGGAGAVNPMPPTSLQATFSGMRSATFSGTWTLSIEDDGVGDTGSISAATLSLCVDPLPDDIFADGFETL